MPPTSPTFDPPKGTPPIEWKARGDLLSGKVPEHAGRRPYELVVLIDEQSKKEVAKARTKDDGAYKFDWVPSGAYRVRLRDPDLPVNINYVYNILSDEKPQTWMDPDLYVAVYMVTLVCGVYPLTHLLFFWWMPPPRKEPRTQ
jgi:hypothetical protein